MVLTVRRSFVARLSHIDDLSALVWEADTFTGEVLVIPMATLPRHVPGLFQCYADGYRITLDMFDIYLAEFFPHWTRRDIEKATFDTSR